MAIVVIVLDFLISQKIHFDEHSQTQGLSSNDLVLTKSSKSYLLTFDGNNGKNCLNYI